MTKHTTIPAGYRLTVESCENDDDLRHTRVLEGLPEENVAYLVDLVKGCRTTSSGWNAPGRFGNMYEPGKEQLDNLKADLLDIAKKHPLVWDDADPSQMDDESLYHLVMADLDSLGLTGEPGNFLTRYTTKWKVELLLESIRIPDVTERFA